MNHLTGENYYKIDKWCWELDQSKCFSDVYLQQTVDDDEKKTFVYLWTVYFVIFISTSISYFDQISQWHINRKYDKREYLEQNRNTIRWTLNRVIFSQYMRSLSKSFTKCQYIFSVKIDKISVFIKSKQWHR